MHFNFYKSLSLSVVLLLLVVSMYIKIALENISLIMILYSISTLLSTLMSVFIIILIYYFINLIYLSNNIAIISYGNKCNIIDRRKIKTCNHSIQLKHLTYIHNIYKNINFGYRLLNIIKVDSISNIIVGVYILKILKFEIFVFNQRPSYDHYATKYILYVDENDILYRINDLKKSFKNSYINLKSLNILYKHFLPNLLPYIFLSNYKIDSLIFSKKYNLFLYKSKYISNSMKYNEEMRSIVKKISTHINDNIIHHDDNYYYKKLNIDQYVAYIYSLNNDVHYILLYYQKKYADEFNKANVNIHKSINLIEHDINNSIVSLKSHINDISANYSDKNLIESVNIELDIISYTTMRMKFFDMDHIIAYQSVSINEIFDEYYINVLKVLIKKHVGEAHLKTSIYDIHLYTSKQIFRSMIYNVLHASLISCQSIQSINILVNSNIISIDIIFNSNVNADTIIKYSSKIQDYNNSWHLYEISNKLQLIPEFNITQGDSIYIYFNISKQIHEKTIDILNTDNNLTENKSVLILEDNPTINMLITKAIKHKFPEYKIKSVGTVLECLELFKNDQYDILILDINLPDGTSIDIFRKVNVKYDSQVIFISGNINLQSGGLFNDNLSIINSHQVLYKPFSTQELIEKIK